MSLQIQIDAIDCGKAFAHVGSNEQSAILNALGSELWITCKGNTNFETQCCFISDELNSSGIRLVNELAEFIRLREEEKARNET